MRHKQGPLEETMSITIDDANVVFAGDEMKGKIKDLLLFIGSKFQRSKNGFCLFFDGRFCIQEGSTIREGVANPMIYFIDFSWDWQLKDMKHFIRVRDRQFIIPLGSSLILFEDANGIISTWTNGAIKCS